MTNKVCIKCSAILTADNWKPECVKNWVYKCQECIRLEKREYQRKWRKANQELSRLRSARHSANLRTNDPVKSRAISAYDDSRKRAIRNFYDFDLTPSHVLNLFRNAKKCPYFGWDLTFSQGNKDKTLASLDRVDSNLGYTKDNVVVISYLANLMKSSASEDELLAFALGVIKMQKEKALPTKADEISAHI